MSVDKLVDSAQLDADLTSVANAIRTKGGTSASLAFPAEFVSAIQAIPTGGGGNDYLADYVQDTLTTYSNSSVTMLKTRAFNFCTKLQSVSLPEVTTLSGDNTFNGSRALQSVYLPKVTILTTMCFNECYSLSTLVAPMVRYIGNNSLKKTALETVCFPKYNDNLASYSLESITPLKVVDLNICNTINSKAFLNSASFNTLILRGASRASALANIDAFAGTPFASGGSGGTLYVPSALISSYQSATNWSIILGYSTNSIQAIEGSIYETQYADGTPIT